MLPQHHSQVPSSNDSGKQSPSNWAAKLYQLAQWDIKSVLGYIPQNNMRLSDV